MHTQMPSQPASLCAWEQPADRPDGRCQSAVLGVDLTNCHGSHPACRMDKYLEAVITFTDEVALSQAKAADALLAEGTYLGPLHGIPYGLKDICAVPLLPTTWGCEAFKDQVLDEECHVYTRSARCCTARGSAGLCVRVQVICC